jgi:hypothetical protein
MAQGFYSLDEASRVLGMTPEEVNQMAQKREIRAFADRGTWRFRIQDVEEKARQLGRGSSPELQLGEAPRPKPHDSPSPGPKATDDASVFTFQLGSEDEVDFGADVGRSAGSSGRMKGGPKSPPPKPGSDSDVRLVSEGSDVGFKIGSDVKPAGDPPSGSQVTKRQPSSGTHPKSDSDVKLVQEHGHTPGDSSIPIGSQPPKSGTDSDIRLEEPSGSGSGRLKSAPDDLMLTEEIDLDSELAAAEEAAKAKKPKGKPKTPHQPMDLTSPYQLQEEAGPTQTGPTARGKETSPDSSSDFSLTPHQDDADSSSPISLSSGEHQALSPLEEEIDLSGSAKPVSPASSDSGINLEAPADSGISLEQSGEGSDEIEFELSLDAESTPKPAPKAAAEDDSSSEFELTLDDSGGLAPLEEENNTSKVPVKGMGAGEKDIFETDFDVPALEDESGSQAVALDESDTDLESSDFDLALGDEDISTEEESGSQVVVLEDEEADEAAATVARTSRRPAQQALVSDDSNETEPISEAEEAGFVDEEELPPRRVAAADADWGYLPGAVMIPCVVIMLFACVMGFELLRGMWSYRQPSKAGTAFVRFFAETFGAELPKD